MSGMDDADLIWNRACDGGGRWPRPGDSHVAALLHFHGFAMNGGVFHSCGIVKGTAIGAAVNGFRYLELDAIADVVAEAGAVAVSGALELDDDRAEELELRFNDRYYSLIPTDQVIVDRFEARLRKHPEEFAPLTQAGRDQQDGN